MKVKIDATKVSTLQRNMRVGGGDMRWATISIDDHTSAVIVYGLTQKEADQRAIRIVEGLKLLDAQQTPTTSKVVKKPTTLDVVGTTGGKATVEK